jgi:hypothetical protein
MHALGLMAATGFQRIGTIDPLTDFRRVSKDRER